MKTKYILFTLFTLFMLSTIAAAQDSIGTYKTNDCVELLQICGTCTFNNITSVVLPNSTRLILDEPMTMRGTEYNYTFCNTQIPGNYLVNGVGDLDGTDNAWAYDLTITKTGKDFTIQESIIYVILTIAVFLFFMLSFYFALAIPYGNETDEQKQVIKVTKTKYVKLAFILLSYVLFVWFLNVLIGISDNFLSLGLYYGFVSFLFNTLNYMALPFGLFIIILSFFEIIRDANLQENINLLFGAGQRG